jgi:PAS domain S-box-containing protein
MHGNKRSLLFRYGLGVLVVGSVFAVRIFAWPVLRHEFPFIFFVAAQALTAWFGGLGPGLLATGLSALIVTSYLLPLEAPQGAHVAGVLAFTLTGVLISWLMQRLHAAVARSEKAEHQMKRRATEAEEGRRILEALLEYIPEGIAIVEGADARVRRVSKFWCTFAGRPRAAVEGTPLQSLLDRRRATRPVTDEHSGATAAPPVMRALQGGEIVTGLEWSLRRSDGIAVPVICSAGPIRDEAGNTVQGVIAWHDITERRRMEQDLLQARADLEKRVQERTAELARTNLELEAERRRLFSLLDTLPFFVCLIGPVHAIRFANRHFRALFPEAESRPSYEAAPAGAESCGSCPACRARKINSQVEWEWASPAGRHYQIYDSPLASNGSDSLVLEIGVDITERRAAEQALQLERNKLLNILTAMREAVYIVNRQNEIEFVNPAFENEFGVIVPGKKCFEQIHCQPEPCPWCKNVEVFEGRSILSEWTSPTTGKVYDVFDTPIVNQDGSISKLKIVHDVTEHKMAEEASRDSQKELQRLSSELLTAQEAERLRISRELHDELGQTLTLVKLRIGLIEMNLPENEKHLREHCESASSLTDQAIENMRRLSRDLRPAALEELGITAALRRLAGESEKASHVSISTQIGNIDPLVPQHSGILLYRVIQETLNNILKHSAATEVTLSAEEKGEWIEFQIRDNGKGMNPEETEPDKVAAGRGLGLAFMRERVRTLGGSLKIVSRKGSGTTLSFAVPICGQGGRT